MVVGTACDADADCPGGACENGEIGCNSVCQQSCPSDSDASVNDAAGEQCDSVYVGGPDAGDQCRQTCSAARVRQLAQR